MISKLTGISSSVLCICLFLRGSLETDMHIPVNGRACADSGVIRSSKLCRMNGVYYTVPTGDTYWDYEHGLTQTRRFGVSSVEVNMMHVRLANLAPQRECGEGQYGKSASFIMILVPTVGHVRELVCQCAREREALCLCHLLNTSSHEPMPRFAG